MDRTTIFPEPGPLVEPDEQTTVTMSSESESDGQEIPSQVEQSPNMPVEVTEKTPTVLPASSQNLETTMPKSLAKRTIMYHGEDGWIRGRIEKFAGWGDEEPVPDKTMYTTLFPDGLVLNLMLNDQNFQSNLGGSPGSWVCLKTK